MKQTLFSVSLSPVIFLCHHDLQWAKSPIGLRWNLLIYFPKEAEGIDLWTWESEIWFCCQHQLLLHLEGTFYFRHTNANFHLQINTLKEAASFRENIAQPSIQCQLPSSRHARSRYLTSCHCGKVPWKVRRIQSLRHGALLWMESLKYGLWISINILRHNVQI